jgi:membrane fusion protein (multidrug efflux system)
MTSWWPKLTGSMPWGDQNNTTDALSKEKLLTEQTPRSTLLQALIVFALLIASGCGSKQEEAPGGAEPAGVQVIPIDVAPVTRTTLTIQKTYPGTLEGEDQATIVAKISERVMEVRVHVGQPLKKGEIALLLDKSGASSQYYQAEANYRNAEKNLERMKSLYKEGAIALQTLDGAQTAFDVAKANFDAARSTVELTTPIAGVVTAVNVNIGDLPSPGMVLATVARIGQMKAIFNCSEADISSIAIGQKVHVYSEVRSQGVVDGQIIEISRSADIRSRSFEVKALFPNSSDRWFKPGMFVRVNVQLAPHQNALVVPNGALLSNGVTSSVYVVREGRVAQRVVQPGVSDGERTEILQGLQLNDTVATTGATTLKEGSRVNIVHPSRP